MRAPSQSLLNALAVTASATLVAGVVSAFSVGSTSTPSSTAQSGAAHPAGTEPDATTTIADSAEAPTTAAAGGPGTTARSATGGPATTVTTAAPLPAVSGPVGDPGQPTAPTPGTYHYTYTYSGNGSEQPTSGSLTKKITTTASSGGVTRQTEVDNGPDSRATRNVTDEWRPSGFFEIREVINFNGQTATCTWSPPVEETPSGLAIGRAWTLEGSCQFTVFGQQVNLHLTGTGKVTGKERVSVGGVSVNVWDVTSNYDATASNAGFGTFTIKFAGKERFAAGLGLIVEEDADTTISSANSGSHTSHVHEAAQSIHPTA